MCQVFLADGIFTKIADFSGDKTRIGAYRSSVKSATINILGSNALSQILIVASTPFLTKQYDQSEFGWFGVATTIALLISTCLTLRLEHSIHVVNDAASRLFNTCLHLIPTLAIAIGLPVILALSGRINDSVGNSVLILIFSVSHATVACSVLNLSFQQRFRLIAVVNLIIPTVFILCAVLLSFVDLGFNRLLFWQTVAYTCGAVFVLVVQRSSIYKLNSSDIFSVVKSQSDNLRFLVPSSMLSILSLNLSVIGTTLLFDSAIAGLVVIAQRIARAPIGVIGNSLNEVLRASIPRRRHILNTFQRIAWSCALVSILMVLTVSALPASVYEWVLGDQWSGIKAVLLITVTGAGFQLMGTSVFSMLTSFNKKADMQVNLALVVCGILSLVVTHMLELSAFGYLWIHTSVFAIIYSVAFFIAYRIAVEKTE